MKATLICLSIVAAYADAWMPMRPKVMPAQSKKTQMSAGLGIIIAGAPASGKGTQCARITEDYGVVHLSTGDLLRAAVAAGSKLGKEAKGYMDSGKLVPDQLVIDLVAEKLASDECAGGGGWLLDGFPRTAAQAKALAETGAQVDAFISLQVPDDVLVERVVGRRTDPVTGAIYHTTFDPPPAGEIADRCTQRSDDTEEKVRVRLDQFHANVAAVSAFYAAVTTELDGNQAKDAVYSGIKAALDAAKDKKKGAAPKASAAAAATKAGELDPEITSELAEVQKDAEERLASKKAGLQKALE